MGDKKWYNNIKGYSKYLNWFMLENLKKYSPYFLVVLTLILGGLAIKWSGFPYLSMAPRFSANISPTANGLVAYWNFDEGSGLTAADASGNGNSGTLMNDPLWISGKVGQALSFDGVNDYVTIGNILSFERTDAFSISAWYKFNITSFETADDQALISKENTGGNLPGYKLNIEADVAGDPWEFHLRSSGSNWLQVRFTRPNDTGWHHIAVTYDGSSDASGVTAYIDGVPQTLTVIRNSLTTSIINASAFHVGQFFGDTFDGAIDEVRVYNRVISAAEIQQDMAVSSSPNIPPPTTPRNPTVSLSADFASITSGQSSTLTWSSTDASSCNASGGWSGAKAVSGSQSVSPTQTTTYTLACAGSGGTATQSVIVTVTAAPTPPTIDSQAPSVPQNLTATAFSSSQINLSWTASTDNTGVTGYRIYRNGVQIATSNTTSYQNTGLSPATAYSYTVAAIDAAGNASNQSASASAMTQSIVSAKFSINDRVQTTGAVRVRQTPSTSGVILGTRATGDQGTVIGGPTAANGYNWWNINYDTGADGWSAENYLAKAVTLPPPPPSPDTSATLEQVRNLANNTWLSLNPKSRTAYQSLVGWAADGVDQCDRTITNGNPIVRTFSGLSSGNGFIFNFGGGHGSHPGNDIDLYDISQNQWQIQNTPECPKPGSQEARGIIGSGGSSPTLTPTGKPFTQHTYQYSVYDSLRKRFYSVLTPGTWSFDLATRQWTQAAGEAKGTFSPKWALNQGLVFYDTAADRIVALPLAPSSDTGRFVYSFNPATNLWSKESAVPSEILSAAGYAEGAYNKDLNEFVLTTFPTQGGTRSLFRYRYGTNTAIKVDSIPAEFQDARLAFDYDSLNKKMIFLVTPTISGASRSIWAWDMIADTWQKFDLVSSAPSGIGARWTFVYDEQYNVFINLQTISLYCGISGGACGGLTKTWAYRFAGGPGPGPAPSIEPSLIFTASPNSVNAGGSAALSWTSSNAASCSATGGWSGSKSLSGTESTGPLSASKTYSLTCTGSGGSVTRAVSVAVLAVASPSADIKVNGLDSISVGAGTNVAVSWTSINTSSCAVSPGNWTGTSGSQNVIVNSTQTYNVNCAGAGGSASDSATVIVGVLPPPPVPGALSIPLSIEEPDGVTRIKEPVTSGVPLPQGTQTSAWALFDGATEIPVQVTTLQGRTPWILLDFQVDISAQGSKTLTLREQASQARPAKSVIITESGSDITVNTGPLKAQINRNRFNLFEGVWLDRDSNGVFADSEKILTAGADAIKILDASTGKEFSGTGAPSRVEWEYRGPMRSTLRVDGTYASGGSSYITYTTRLTFYAGSAEVEVEHILRNSYQLNRRHVKIRSASLLIGSGTAAVRATRSGSVSWSRFNQGIRFELLPQNVNRLGDVDVNGGMPLPDLSYHGASVVVDFSSVGDSLSRSKAVKSPLFALAPSNWYSEYGELTTTKFGTLEDEKETYRRWGWTWEASQEPSYPHQPDYSVDWTQVSVHYDSESDDAWQNVLMYLRTRKRGFLDRALAWARFQKWEMVFRTDGFDYKGDSGWESRSDKVIRPDIAIPLTPADSKYINTTYDGRVDIQNWGGDHFWGWGMIDYYYLTGDRDVIEASNDLGEISERIFGWKQSPYDPFYGVRQVGRNLTFAVRAYELTQNPRWKNLADHIIGLLLESPKWDPRGTYWASGDLNVMSPHHMAELGRGFERYYVLTNNAAVRDRLIKMADFAKKYALDPVYLLTVKSLTKSNLESPESEQITVVNGYHTLTWIDNLIRGYRLTGDLSYLERAKFHWDQGSKAGYQRPPTYRVAGPDQVGRFINNRFACCGPYNLYFDSNGHLPFADLLFYDHARVTVPSNLVPTLTFSADKISVPYNQSLTLSWSSKNANSCIAYDGWSGAKALSGTEVVGPLKTTKIFILNCYGGIGIVQRLITVSVGAPPALPGSDPSLLINYSFDSSDVDFTTLNPYALDVSGQGNNGQIVGAIPVVGKQREALQFDGVSSYLRLPSIARGPNRTISFWFKADKDLQKNVMDILYNEGVPGYPANLTIYFELDSTKSNGLGKLITHPQWSAASPKLEAPAGYGDGTWHHYALTITTGRTAVYLDGKEVAANGENGVSFSEGDSGPFIATHSKTLRRNFHGALDEFRLYNRALTAAEVLALYTSVGN